MTHVHVVPVKNIKNAVADNSRLTRRSLSDILCTYLPAYRQMEFDIFQILAGARYSCPVGFMRGQTSGLPAITE